MKSSHLFVIICFCLFCSSTIIAQTSTEVVVTNQGSKPLEDAFVLVDLKDAKSNWSLTDGTNEIPHQILQNNGKLQLGFVVNLNGNESKKLFLRNNDANSIKNFPARTYAELAMKTENIHYGGKFRGNKFENVTRIKVPLNHTDHDALFKYEGPGWESEKVGYRFYLDWRNATDIFGKKTPKLLLHNVGIHDTVAKDDSYHEMQEWGMDIFKVGNTLGIGSIGMLSDSKVNMVSKTDSIYCEIVENGPVRSKVRTDYFGWLVGNKKFNLRADFSITAGSRFTRTELQISGEPENIVTGLAKFKGTSYIRSEQNGEWNYIGLYGNQTLVNENDKLGIALIYKSSSLIELTEDTMNYIVKLKPAAGLVEYYFCAAWEQEPNGIKNEKEFIEYLNDSLELLNNPVTIKIKYK